MFRPYFVGDNAFCLCAVPVFCGWPHPFEATAQMELQMKFYFYTFPPSILMLFLFAQYSLKIVLFLAVLDGIFLVTVLRDLHRKKRKYSPKKFWRLKRSDLNAFLFVSVCVSMVPTCMMIYWKLESPSGVAELYERKKDYNLVQNQENIFQEIKNFC